MLKKAKIPCYVLVFDQVNIIRESLECLTHVSDKLDIIVIENPSPHSSKIKPLVDAFGKAGLIKRHYLFDNNITGNAFGSVINIEKQLVQKSPFVILTDGDLRLDNNDWLDEELSILKKHRDIFACGVSLDLSNLPLKTFPDAKDWMPPDISEHRDFYETLTGIHLLMLRGPELYDFMQWKNANELSFVDGEMHRHARENLLKKWVRTKKARAYHLTWDLYADKKHPYTELKTSKGFQATWLHNDHAAYALTEY